MSQRWILDVLEDLKTFAQENDLPVLASHLEDASIVAISEITSVEKRALLYVVGGDEETTGELSRRAGKSKHA